MAELKPGNSSRWDFCLPQKEGHRAVGWVQEPAGTAPAAAGALYLPINLKALI